MRSGGMPTRETRRLMELLGYKDLYPPQEEALRAGVEAGENILLATPTASGKTFIAMTALANNLAGGTGFYTVPLRSIAQEKYRQFKVLEELGYRVRVSIGDYAEGAPRADIVITTYEKLDSMLRNEPNLYNRITVLAVDEIHYIGESKRGPILESLLARITSLSNPQIVALSATVPNAWEIAEWLGAKAVVSDWRPVPLREGVYRQGTIHYSDGSTKSIVEETGQAHIDLAIDSSRGGGQVIVFTQSRRRASQLAVKAAKYGSKLVYDDARAREAARVIRQTEGPSTLREELAGLLERGVSYHHAGLSNRQRQIVEDAFRDGGIAVVYATPTLAAGVNLPARRVVVEDYYRFEEGMRRPISVAEYKQLAGRAGRPGLDPYGEAVIIARGRDTVEELMEDYILAGPEPVESRLGGLRGLRHSILGTIVAGVTRLRSIVEIHANTLYARSLGTRKMGSLIARAIEDLVSWGLATLQGDTLAPTLLGVEAARNYLDPESVEAARRLLPRLGDAGDLGLLYTISSLPDMTRLPVTRREEDYLLDRLLDEAPELVDRLEWTGPGEMRVLKTTLLLLDWINEVGDEEIASRYNVGPGDVAALVDTAAWLSRSLSGIARMLGHQALGERLSLLEKRIRHGIKEELLPLVAIPGIGRARARRLYNHGYKTIHDLIITDPRELLKIPGIGPGVVARILEFTGRREEAERYSKMEGLRGRGLQALMD